MNLKIRLALMNFLEFAVWGAYLTSMGRYLGNRQISHRAMQAAGTKRAVHIAANLTGNADAVSVIMMHQDGFDGIPVRQLQ